MHKKGRSTKNYCYDGWNAGSFFSNLGLIK